MWLLGIEFGEWNAVGLRSLLQHLNSQQGFSHYFKHKIQLKLAAIFEQVVVELSPDPGFHFWSAMLPHHWVKTDVLLLGMREDSSTPNRHPSLAHAEVVVAWKLLVDSIIGYGWFLITFYRLVVIMFKHLNSMPKDRLVWDLEHSRFSWRHRPESLSLFKDILGILVFNCKLLTLIHLRH